MFIDTIILYSYIYFVKKTRDNVESTYLVVPNIWNYINSMETKQNYNYNII